MFTYFTNLTWPKLAKLTWILIGIFIALIFSLCLFKYFTYAYNGLDLAIFNQVFFNSSQGSLFSFTIHPGSYLGDHFEIIILFLLPFYGLFKSPLTLLLIQACFLGFSAIPLYLIAKKHLSPLLGLMIICLYLFNPATLNIALFEFHILSLVIFFCLWAFYFYDQNKFWPFLGFCFLALLVREDVAFIIFMFGIIALLDRKKIQWIFTPIIMATAYFFTAIKISAYFLGAPNYKFLVYYSWLGNSLTEMFINFFLKFPEVINYVFSNTGYLELLFNLLLIMLFLPAYRPKYLLLALPVLLEFVLGPDSSAKIIGSHYISLFLPGLLIASIFSIKALSQNPKVIRYHQKYPAVIPAVFIACLAYLIISLSGAVLLPEAISGTDYEQVALKNKFADLISKDAGLLTTIDLIPNLSSRAELYSFHYAYFNQRQFNSGPYNLPESLEYIFINFDEWQLLDNYGQSSKFHDAYFSGAQRFRDLLAKDYELIRIEKNLGLWQKNAQKSDLVLYEILEEIPSNLANKKSPQSLGPKIEFLFAEKNNDITSLYFKCLEKMDKNYFLKINGQYLILGYGIYPTRDWEAGEIIKINLFDFGDFKSFELASPKGKLKLGPLNSLIINYTDVEIIGLASLD